MLEAANVPVTVGGWRLTVARPSSGCRQLFCVFVRVELRHKLRQRRPNSESEGGLGLVLGWEQN